jgi:hypothetical protein
MGEIKSAWEIAMEKVEKLGKLPPEELRRQKEKKYALIGQALADKYLGGLDLWQQAIELRNYERLARIMEGISYLKEGGKVGEIAEEIKQLLQEYKQAEQKEKEEMEKSGRGILHQLRISGNAIGAVNPKAIGEWQQELDRLAQPYRDRLEPLRQRLLDLPSEQIGAEELS